MRRWKVYKDTEDRWMRWIARPDCPPWHEEYRGYRFPQWDMAMRYANSRSRSNTITIYDRSKAFCYLTATVNERNHIDLKSGDDTFILARHEWKPLAKFLLAANRHMEHEALQALGFKQTHR